MLSVLVLAAALLATPARSASDLLTSDQRAWLAEHPDLVIGFPENQPPAVVTAQDGRMEGVFVEYLNLLNRRLGTDIRAELGPWPDLVERAERREIDMLGFTFRLAAHRTHFEFTDTVIKTYYYIYTRSDDPDPPGDLAALAVALGLERGAGEGDAGVDRPAGVDGHLRVGHRRRRPAGSIR